MMPNWLRSKLFPFLLTIGFLLTACAPAVTELPSMKPPESSSPSVPEGPYTVEEAEAAAGFDVQEPAYLHLGVSLDHATYQASPTPAVTLHFKLVHEIYGDMGPFFQVMQQRIVDAIPNPAACGTSGSDCETIQVGDRQVQYRLTEPTESLTWESGDFVFLLTRTAGEPGKLYKDELLQVADSMK